MLPYDSAMRALSFGIKRKDDFFTLQVSLFSDHKLIQQQRFPIELKGHYGSATSRYSKEIIFMLNDTSQVAADRHLEITDIKGEPITVIEPLYNVDSKNASLGYAYYSKSKSEKN